MPLRQTWMIWRISGILRSVPTYPTLSVNSDPTYSGWVRLFAVLSVLSSNNNNLQQLPTPCSNTPTPARPFPHQLTQAFIYLLLSQPQPHGHQHLLELLQIYNSVAVIVETRKSISDQIFRVRRAHL